MAVAAASRVCDSGARELQPLIERRILFHPAKDAALSSGISSLPAGIEPLNRGFDASPTPPPAPAPAGPGNAGAASPNSKGIKRSWQEANGAAQLDQSPLRIGAGLVNLGNTCFLNSVLQCLTYTQPLANYLRTGQHKASCRLSGFCALCGLEVHVNNALQSRGQTVSPNYIVKNLRSISRSFQPYRQEDAHEYLRYLMEALQRSCLPHKTPINSPEQEKTFMHNVFCGRLRSEVKCTVCLQRSETLEPFWDLSLDITRADSLGKALAWFTANEILDGENKYNCSKCNKKARAIKRFTIESAPSILTVQFKRFSSTGMHGQKIDKKVHFGRKLDITPFMSNSRDGAVYDLYGVLVHSGHSTHSGHYYCFVRTSGEMWYLLDDSRVKQLSEQNVLDQKAYILFYTRKQTKNPQSSGPSKVATAKPAGDPLSSPSIVTQATKKVALEAPGEAAALSKAPEPETSVGVQAQSEKAPATEPERSTPVQKIAPADAPASVAPEAPGAEGREDGDEAPRVDAPEADPVVAPSTIPAENGPATQVETPELEVENSSPARAVEKHAEPMIPVKSPVVVAEAASAPDECTVPVEAPLSVHKEPAESIQSRGSGKKSRSNSPPAETETTKQNKISGKRSRSNSPRKSLSPSSSPRKAVRAEPAVAPVECTASAEPSSSVQIIEQEEEPAEYTSFPEPDKQSKSSMKKAKCESPRKFLSARKTESPRKAYLKLLRAMPKKRRVFLARALELEQVERPEMKRRRLVDSPEFKPKPATPEVDVAANQQLPPAAKQSSGASKPVSSSSELFGSGVARWDDVDGKDIDRFLRTEHKVSAKRPDEWDEEYDRGKVKKVRRVAVGGRLTPCKNNEGGQSSNSNPFQVLAGNKHKK